MPYEEEKRSQPWWRFWQRREDESWLEWFLSWTWEYWLGALVVLAFAIATLVSS